MSDWEIDLYSGYEGEPEIRFVSAGANVASCVRLWHGYFDSIMSHVAPGPDGWTGLALPYHLYEGWYEHSPWALSNVEEALGQLENARGALVQGSDLDRASVKALDAIVNLLQVAVRTGATVSIEYD